jgi:ribosomal protein S2
MQKITKEDLLNSGAHFGHVSSKTDLKKELKKKKETSSEIIIPKQS